MAAHLDGKAVRVMDMTGLAQKGGAVVSHIQLAPNADDIRASKISAGAADLLLVCDLVVGALPDNLGRISRGAGRVIANDHESITGAFTRDPDVRMPTSALRKRSEEHTSELQSLQRISYAGFFLKKKKIKHLTNR